MLRHMNWIPVITGLLHCMACSMQARQNGKVVPVKFTIEYEGSQSAADAAQRISRSWQPLFAVLETNPIQIGTAGEVTGSIGTTTPSTDWQNEEMKRLLMPPRDLIAQGVDLFAYKRAFRWLTFNINQNGRLIKTGSIPLDDPKILEIPPIEIDATEGDLLSASVSLLQVDFMNGDDSDSFCRSGAPGFVRTWKGSAEQKVTSDVGISINMKQMEATTVHRSLIALNSAEADNFRVSEAQQFLVDTSTGMRVDKKLCPVFDLPLKADNRPEFRFIKAMTFSTPLQGYLLGIDAPTFGLKFLPAKADRPEYQEVDLKAAWDLGITFASIKETGSEYLLPAPPFEKVLGGVYDITARPLVELGQTPKVDDQKSQVVITWPVVVNALNPVFNLSKIRPVTYSSTGAAPVCSTNLFMDSTNSSGKLMLTCTGTGSVSVSLDDGFATDEVGIKSYPADSYPAGGGTYIPIDTASATTTATDPAASDVGSATAF